MRDEPRSLPGLTAPVEIRLDRWGVAHIRAAHPLDAFMAQGFNAARDRLWQIDLWRKRGLGLLARDFGPGYLAQDRAARLFLYRGDMQEEWACYGPDAQAICTAFTTGINAYIDLLEHDPDLLPPEFVALRTRPDRWAPDDVVRIRTHGWTRNVLSEVTRSLVMARRDAAVDRFRLDLEPPVVPRAPRGLDLTAIPPAVLEVYALATAPVTFSQARLEATIEDAWRWSRVAPDGGVDRRGAPAGSGSNNWAVHGRRTETGRPVLASDPHRLHAVPSLRHLVHLSAPGLDVIGAVEPSFPGITIGHNDTAAFGLTLFLGPDQEDLYVYDAAPDGRRYRYGDGWEPLIEIEERFDVKGAEPVTARLCFTRHGPVVHHEAADCRLFALRTVWAEPGTAPYAAGLAAMRAKSLDEFRTALRRWRVPAVNQVYADVTGAIAWMTAGLAPIRRNWDGLLPVPGDGRFEWDGFIDAAAMPSAVNPPDGAVWSANAFNLPDGWNREAAPFGFEWDDPSRRDRLRSVLGSSHRHSISAACDLQNDVLSLPARRLTALLRDLSPVDGQAARAVALLAGWDHRLDVDSPAAALFEIWWQRHLRPAVLLEVAPDPGVRGLLGVGDINAILRRLEAHADASLLVGTLAAAIEEAVTLLGSDSATWAWGSLHRWQVRHALADVAPQINGNVGPWPVGGSESTVMKAAYRVSDFGVTMGASVRLVIDVGEWDNSLWINTPGQSGDPRCRHYADLAPLWARGEYVPMLYSEAAVHEATVRTIRLDPATG